VAYFPLLTDVLHLFKGNPEERRHFFMRDYELVFIVHPDLDETAVNDLINRVKTWISDSGGEIVKEDFWGKRKLAYPLRKQQEGQYVFLKTQMSPDFVSELDRSMRLSEPIIRYLITNVE
jgi:small subunit ribosomal protein S6